MSIPVIASIQIRCPICNKINIIKVKEDIVDRSESGITAINVMPKIVCEHSFVAYIDKNLSVRDCFVCDFKVKLPEIQLEVLKEPTDLSFDIDLIKYNLIPSLMTNIIVGVHLNKNIAIINDLDFFNERFLKFFDYLYHESFDYKIHFINENEFKKSKKEFKNYLILKGHQILRDKEKIIDEKKTKIENSIVEKFFSEYDSKSGIIIFKNELTKLFKLSQDLIEINTNLRQTEDFTTKKAIMFINEKYHTKISYPYVHRLMDIVEHYFDVKLKRASDSGDLLGLI